MNAPTGTKRDGAEIGLAPEANGFMEGRGPGPELGGREKSFKESPCPNILSSTYQSFLGTQESELPLLPVALLRPHAPSHLHGHPHHHASGKTPIPPTYPHTFPCQIAEFFLQLVTLLIPTDSPFTPASLTSVTPFHQAPVKSLWLCKS